MNVKYVLIPLELTAAASSTDATTHKKVFGSCMTALTISNEEVNHIKILFKNLVY